MVGIGGIGMSGLARLYLHEGKEVSGSDSVPSGITVALEREGIRFCLEQVAGNISDDVDLVVYTEAIPKDHPELLAAGEKGIETINYFEALGMVANEYYLIAVAGSHGKTTTTAMLIDILEEGSLDPTAIVGSLRTRTHSNFRAGKSKYFIAEACEYRRDFLSLTPDLLVITNIEAEHLDYYKDLQDVQNGFRELGSRVREGGNIIARTSDPNVAPVLDGLGVEVVDYKKYFDPSLQLTQPGLHNQLNAAAAAAAAATLGVSTPVIREALENFAGTWRRFEYKGELNGAPVYDDYGHHPSEIVATLTGARERHPGARIVLVFQPHLASRTAKLKDDFITALSQADRLILTDAYAARKQDTEGLESKALAEMIQRVHTDTRHIESFDAIAAVLKSGVTKDDVVIIMGAGTITKLATQVIV